MLPPSHGPVSLHAEQNERARNLRPGASRFLFGPRPGKAGLWALARGHPGAGASALLPREGLPAFILFEAWHRAVPLLRRVGGNAPKILPPWLPECSAAPLLHAHISWVLALGHAPTQTVHTWLHFMIRTTQGGFSGFVLRLRK